LGVNDIDYPAKSKEYLGTRVILKGEDIIADDIEKSDLPDYYIDTQKKMNIKSYIAIPLDKWGVLALSQVNNYRHWTEEEIQLLHTIADQAYIAIRQAELYTNTEATAKKEALLRTINNEILTSKSFEDAINSILSETGKLFNTDRSLLRLYDPVKKSFSGIVGEYRANENIPSTLATVYPFDFDEYITEQVFNKKEFLIINNPEDLQYPESIREELKKNNISSIVITPLIYGDNPIGTLSFTYMQSPKIWSEKDSELLRSLVQQISIGMHLFSLNERLSKALKNEKDIRSIIVEGRKSINHDDLFSYVLNQISDIFNVERVLHIHYRENNHAIYVENEVLKNSNLDSLLCKTILSPDQTQEIMPKSFDQVIAIDDINTQIENKELRDFLLNYKIHSLMVYPRSSRITAETSNEIVATTIICSSNVRKWLSDEMETFKLAIDMVSTMYFEIIQRIESEELRGTFLATLTHDLRSPINAEQKAIEAIILKKFGTSLEDFSEYLEDIYRTNEELLRIVNNILSVYHYESGRFELNQESNDINEIINSVVRSIRPLAQEKNTDINVITEGNIPLAFIDRGEINRVILNLVGNAIKHNQPNTDVTIKARRVNNEIEISISDNGKGISPEDRPKIFQRFPTLKRKVGTGLGLYLSKQIVEAHGGNIWFETEEQKGTTFYFTLPVS